jgi:hypothetical protein
MRKKLTIALIAVCLILGVVFATGAFAKEKEVTPSKMAERLENAIKEVLGDDYKKQTETVVAGTQKYADKEGNEINYHILKTTYYEADPTEVTGLNVNALGVLFNPDSANSCKEMKIKDWDAALYEFDELSYLCWTDTPEASYVLEYNPDVIPDEEILKMAESAEVPKDE